MDPSAIMNRKFTRYAVELAVKHGIKHQVAVRKSGSTDARAVHLTREGVPTIVLGVPARYIHSHISLIHLDDYEATVRLVHSPPARSLLVLGYPEVFQAAAVNGTGSQTGGLSRWGDYSSMAVDPVDDRTFWFTT